MEPLRNITLCATHQDIEIHARWIPTHENTLTDLLPRRLIKIDQFPLTGTISLGAAHYDIDTYARWTGSMP